MEQDFLGELKAYVGFRDDHAQVLAELKPSLEPSFPAIVERFYEAILANPKALSVFTGGLPQVERQKAQLTGWLHGLFSGRYDLDYLQLRARIGRTHVRIQLEQRYVIGGMNLVRSGLHQALGPLDWAPARRPLAHDAIDKICDIELAIMVETFAENYAMRLRDVERLATLGQLAGFVGHELRNPLAVMETSLHLLKKRLPSGDENLTRHARRLAEQLTVCGNIISSLLDLARDKPLERGSVDVPALVSKTLESVPLPSDISLSTVFLEGLPSARVDEKQLRHVIVNLLTNAIDALSQVEGAREIELAFVRESDVLLVAVDDNGPGIPEDFRARLFQPFATTRQKGLGLGLSLCRRIAEKHGGDIRAQRSIRGGARFEVRLPGAFGDE